MDLIYSFFLFLFGIAIGSFLNVVSLRYIEGERLFMRTGGRSHCMTCGKTLAWYELVPLFSFLAQGGKCRSCKARLSLQYPVVELLGGIIFVAVPFVFIDRFGPGVSTYALAAIWVLVLLSLLVMSAIDLRLQIIPDGLTIFIAVLGILATVIYFFYGDFGAPHDRGAVEGTFLGSYSFLFPFSTNLFLSRLFGVLFGAVFLGGLFFGTGGRGIGFGDVKLAFALGFLLGLGDQLLALVLAFIFGAVFSIPLLARGRGLKTAVPFGPFIALGVAVVLFFGYDIVNAYFALFDLN